MSDINAVLYSDGGAEPPRGPGGSGLFGYTYKEHTSAPNDDSWHPTTEGYYTLKNIPATARWVQPLEVLEGLVSYPMPVTNNIAELGAAILAFELIVKHGWKSVFMRPDSEYVRENFEKSLDKWRQNGWQTASHEPVKNQAQWEALYQLKVEVERGGSTVQWRWVKGHSEDPGNQRADQLATQGKGYAKLAKAIRETRITEALPVVRGETIKVPGPNKLLDMPRWYFTNDAGETHKNATGHSVYYGGSHGKDDELFAKPMADSTYVVALLKDADPVLEALRAKQYALNPDNLCEMVIGHLDNILTPRVYDSLFVNGTRWIDPYPGTNDLLSGGEQLLTRELTKPRLALNAITTLVQAESLLNDHLAGTLKDVYTCDITDSLYDLTEKKGKVTCKLKKDISTAVKTIAADLEYGQNGKVKGKLKTRLVLGQDLPRRNTLSHLASLHPKVTVLSWSKDPGSVYFATVVEAGGDASIWMGYPANYRVIPKE